MEEAIDFCANSRGSYLYNRNIYLNVPLVQNLSLAVYELQTLNFRFLHIKFGKLEVFEF